MEGFGAGSSLELDGALGEAGGKLGAMNFSPELAAAGGEELRRVSPPLGPGTN